MLLIIFDEKIEDVRDGKLKMNSQKFDDSLESNDALNKCVVDHNLVQRA